VTGIGIEAFCRCVNLREINLHESSVEVIHEYAFDNCISPIAVYFPNALQHIGDYAFSQCYSLISAELSPTVQVRGEAFYCCGTLELRQPQVDINSLTYEQRFQRSHERIRYLKVSFDGLPIHKLCNDPNITQDKL